jgi:transcriptional regulator with XRE-family HTH domain
VSGTLSAPPVAKPGAPVRDFLPAVAQYDPIAPTSASFGMSPGYPLRRMEVTSGSVDTATALAVIGAAGWLTAALRLSADSTRLLVRLLEGAGGTFIATRVMVAPHHVLTATSQPEEIRKLRRDIQRATGLSRQEIARLVGVDRRSLSAWASGETPPSELNMERLHSLADLARRLTQLDAPELASSMRNAGTAGRVTSAIRARNVDHALEAVLVETDDEPAEAEPPLLTQGQWDALIRLATASASGEITAEDPDDVVQGRARERARIKLDPAAYATPKRSRRSPPGT